MPANLSTIRLEIEHMALFRFIVPCGAINKRYSRTGRPCARTIMQFVNIQLYKRTIYQAFKVLLNEILVFDKKPKTTFRKFMVQLHIEYTMSAKI